MPDLDSLGSATDPPVPFLLAVAIWGWHTDGVHPDPVMRWIEGGPRDGVFDLDDDDMVGSQLHDHGRRVELPGWWRLLPAVAGGMDRYATAHADTVEV